MVSGLDFADALHLAAARDCEAFVTFDQALVKSATRLDGVLARTP
jgi:predicted nucleic acid-binding protein